MTQDIKKGRALRILEEEPFLPRGLFASAHVQTLYQPLFRRNEDLGLRHQKIEAEDGEELDVFLCEDFASAESPLVVIAHGLEGSHESPYVRGLQHALRRKGWGSAALVHRSCGGRINERQRTYHSGETGDLASVVAYLIDRFPERPFFVVGYSLSANQVAKWFGSAGEALPKAVVAGAAVSPPFDLTVTSRRIDVSLWGIYRREFLRTLRPKGVEKHRRYPGLLDIDRIRKLKTLRGFDDAVTAPLHGFQGAEDYYEKVAWPQFASSIRRPLLVLAARDDPFSPGTSIPTGLGETNPWLHLFLTDKGGHVGFVQGRLNRPVYWSELEICRFFEFYSRFRQARCPVAI